MTDYTRRGFLKVLGVAGAAGAGVVTAGCGGNADTDMGPAAQTPEPVAETPAAANETFTCMDTSGLAEADVTMRTTLQYTDSSPEADKDCANCSLYVVSESGSGCGTCLTVKGPIHPKGYCTIWAAQTG